MICRFRYGTFLYVQNILNWHAHMLPFNDCFAPLVHRTMPKLWAKELILLQSKAQSRARTRDQALVCRKISSLGVVWCTDQANPWQKRAQLGDRHRSICYWNRRKCVFKQAWLSITNLASKCLSQRLLWLHLCCSQTSKWHLERSLFAMCQHRCSPTIQQPSPSSGGLLSDRSWKSENQEIVELCVWFMNRACIRWDVVQGMLGN